MASLKFKSTREVHLLSATAAVSVFLWILSMIFIIQYTNNKLLLLISIFFLGIWIACFVVTIYKVFVISRRRNATIQQHVSQVALQQLAEEPTAGDMSLASFRDTLSPTLSPGAGKKPVFCLGDRKIEEDGEDRSGENCNSNSYKLDDEIRKTSSGGKIKAKKRRFSLPYISPTAPISITCVYNMLTASYVSTLWSSLIIGSNLFLAVVIYIDATREYAPAIDPASAPPEGADASKEAQEQNSDPTFLTKHIVIPLIVYIASIIAWMCSVIFGSLMSTAFDKSADAEMEYLHNKFRISSPAPALTPRSVSQQQQHQQQDAVVTFSPTTQELGPHCKTTTYIANKYSNDEISVVIDEITTPNSNSKPNLRQTDKNQPFPNSPSRASRVDVCSLNCMTPGQISTSGSAIKLKLDCTGKQTVDDRDMALVGVYQMVTSHSL